MRKKRCIGCLKPLKENKYCVNKDCKFGAIHAEILKLNNKKG